MRAPSDVIDMHAYAAKGYPHESWRRLRAEQPVAWCEVEGYPPFWAITKHADVVDLSKAPHRFENAPMMAVFPKAQYEAESFPFRHLINMDPPEHREYRRVLSGHFTPRELEKKRAHVATVVDELLDGLAGREEIDFVHDVASIMPIVVIAEMLGIPREDRDRFFHWTNQLIAGTDPEYQDQGGTEETVETAVRDLFAYFEEMAEARRRQPTDDLTSIVANAKIQGGPMPRWELVSYLALVIVAGNETTRNATTGGMLALLEHPEQLERLRGDPSLVPTAVEEILRWTSPVINMARTPVEDFTLRGERIRAGETLCLFYPSANRDEEVFADPFAFRIDRKPNRHLAFGIGEHVCLGAHLARLELQELFVRLLRRVPRISIAGEPARQLSSFVGGIKHLPLRIGA